MGEGMVAAADTAADAAVGSSGFVLDKGLEVGTGELCSCPPLPTRALAPAAARDPAGDFAVPFCGGPRGGRLPVES